MFRGGSFLSSGTGGPDPEGPWDHLVYGSRAPHLGGHLFIGCREAKMEIYGVEERPSCPGFRPIEGSAEALNKSMSCIDSIKPEHGPLPAPRGRSGFSTVGSRWQQLRGWGFPATSGKDGVSGVDVGGSIVGRPGCGLWFTSLLVAGRSLALPPSCLPPWNPRHIPHPSSLLGSLPRSLCDPSSADLLPDPLPFLSIPRRGSVTPVGPLGGGGGSPIPGLVPSQGSRTADTAVNRSNRDLTPWGGPHMGIHCVVEKGHGEVGTFLVGDIEQRENILGWGVLRQRGQQVQRKEGRKEGRAWVFSGLGRGQNGVGILGEGRETETQRDEETEAGWPWLTTCGGRVAGTSAFPRLRGDCAVWEKCLGSPIRVVNVLAAVLKKKKKHVKGNR